jgi:hypothetical protein
MNFLKASEKGSRRFSDSSGAVSALEPVCSSLMS